MPGSPGKGTGAARDPPAAAAAAAPAGSAAPGPRRAAARPCRARPPACGDSRPGEGCETPLQGSPQCLREPRAAVGLPGGCPPARMWPAGRGRPFCHPIHDCRGSPTPNIGKTKTSAPATGGCAESSWISPYGWGGPPGPHPWPHPCPHPSCPIPVHCPGGTHLFRVSSKASFSLLASWMRRLILARNSSRLSSSWGSSCRSFTQSCQISCLQGQGCFGVSIPPKTPKPGQLSH